LLPSEAMLFRIEFSIESNTVNTDITQKIPIVIPSNESIVLTLFTIMA
jgi:hypothetical protein